MLNSNRLLHLGVYRHFWHGVKINISYWSPSSESSDIPSLYSIVRTVIRKIGTFGSGTNSSEIRLKTTLPQFCEWLQYIKQSYSQPWKKFPILLCYAIVSVCKFCIYRWQYKCPTEIQTQFFTGLRFEVEQVSRGLSAIAELLVELIACRDRYNRDGRSGLHKDELLATCYIHLTAFLLG